jgi:hypothetical protein
MYVFYLVYGLHQGQRDLEKEGATRRKAGLLDDGQRNRGGIEKEES